jgi:hypothetical protein
MFTRLALAADRGQRLAVEIHFHEAEQLVLTDADACVGVRLEDDGLAASTWIASPGVRFGIEAQQFDRPAAAQLDRADIQLADF